MVKDKVVIPKKKNGHILNGHTKTVIPKMACNLYIEQIERAGGNLLGNCSCGQPVGSHLHEIPPPATQGNYPVPVNSIVLPRRIFSIPVFYLRLMNFV
jgi:hypothetical protein